MSCELITCQIYICINNVEWSCVFLFSSEPDVPDVILDSKSHQLWGSRSTANGPSHSPNDGIGGHSWPCGTGDMQKLCIQNLCRLYQILNISFSLLITQPNTIIFFLSGLSQILHRLLLACSSLWKDVIWPSPACCGLYHCLPGGNMYVGVLFVLNMF